MRTAVLIAALGLAPAAIAPGVMAQGTLVSVKTDAAPAIDGTMEAAWNKAAPLKVELGKLMYDPANYKGSKKTTVELRSLYDANAIYFLVQWADPTQSLERGPWVKQADGSWKKSKDLDETGHANAFYEDKLALMWNINATGFDTKGCAVTCHKARGGRNAGIEDKSPGRKWTNKEGETTDLWHWKAARSNPVGQMDDQYVDATKNPAQNADWGRKSNDKTGGGYADNASGDGKTPAFMNGTPGDANKYWVLDDGKAPFADTFKAGDVIGGVVVAPFAGPRGNIAAKARWENGRWTLEIRRALVTQGANAKTQDVQFSDLKKTYFFGVSAFDNTQLNHLYHEGANKLTFK
jgi:hypothetical protein